MIGAAIVLNHCADSHREQDANNQRLLLARERSDFAEFAQRIKHPVAFFFVRILLLGHWIFVKRNAAWLNDGLRKECLTREKILEILRLRPALARKCWAPLRMTM